jgi:ATP-dependent Clp protease ATP-binding subunit ClpA
MFEDFSERARRIVFFSRKVAGERGAGAIGVEDLMQVLVLEDQADYAKLFTESAVPGASRMAVPTHRPFLTAEVAREIQRGLEPLMQSKAKSLPTSVDMPLSEAAQRVLLAAMELSEVLRGPAMPSRIQVQQVEPLHLVAAVLSENTSATAEILNQAGIASEAVIAAIKSGEYS